jgi:hypothetical protein
MIRYPSSEKVTPHGWHSIIKGDQPMMWLDAYDDSVRIDLMGGHSIPDHHEAPECVLIPRDGLTGLVPPWRHIDQKGATQDGVTQVDALYEPTEVNLKVLCRGRDGQHTQRVVRDFYASLDAKQESTLNFITHDMGHWWAPVRWFKGGQTDPVKGGQSTVQPLSVRLRADSAFWQTYPDTASFSFTYDSMTETFNTDYSADQDLGADWPQHYIGAGAGYCSTTTTASGFKQARWYESGTTAREVVNGPYKDFDTDTDNQVVEMVLGSFPEITFPGGAFNDLWGRMGRDVADDWNGDGVRARIGLAGTLGWVQLSWWVDFEMVRVWHRPMVIPPLYGEKFSLVCGVTGDPRVCRVLRNGVPILSHKESDTQSFIDEDHRGIGFGMAAGSGIASQASPAWVRKISAGDNSAVTQSGFLSRVNIGDQKMYDDYQFYGPGTVRIYDGPGSTDYVEFGPLAKNQAALLRTDPRDRNVYDMAFIPAEPTEQEKNIFHAALSGLLSFLTLTNTNPVLQVVQSIFGIFGARQAPSPPQGNLYALLKGRFSDRAAIPAKSPGNPAQEYHVKVEIRNGNADSKLIVSGVPLRRSPL